MFWSSLSRRRWSFPSRHPRRAPRRSSGLDRWCGHVALLLRAVERPVQQPECAGRLLFREMGAADRDAEELLRFDEEERRALAQDERTDTLDAKESAPETV